MKTFIINLERSKKRREHILSEAQRCGLNYEIVRAVDGSQLTEEDFDRWCDMNAVKERPNWLTPGMIGCALSHFNVYKKIVEDKIDMALVLEDDVILPDNLNLLLDDIKNNIKPNEVITLYYFSFDTCQLSSRKVEKLSNGFGLHYPIDIEQPITTAGYVITGQAARTLSEIIVPVRVSPDSWGYFYKNDGFDSFRCVYPVPLKLTGAKSDIHSQSIRGKITRFIDDNKIPIIYSIIRHLRQRNIKEMSKIEIINKISPIEK